MPLFETNFESKKKFVPNAIRTLASTTHLVSGVRQESDYYATDPRAVDMLVKADYVHLQNKIWEPCCGEGYLSKRLIEYGYDVYSSDILDYGFGDVKDFMMCESSWDGDIITNPPYKQALPIINHAISLCKDGSTVAMFLKLLWLESKERGEWFKKFPPKYVMVCRGRINCAREGRFDEYASSAVAYAWFVWEKGYTGDPVIKWIN